MGALCAKPQDTHVDDSFPNSMASFYFFLISPIRSTQTAKGKEWFKHQSSKS